MTTLAKRKPIFALETIEYQKDNFGHKLDILFESIIDKYVSGVYTKRDINECQEVKMIVDIIFKRTGIKIKLITDKGLAEIIPLFLTPHHPLLNEPYRGSLVVDDQKKIIKDAQNKKGSVDLQKSTVSGIFSEYEHQISINIVELIGPHFKLNSKELAAVLLHELGHAFTFCEYSDRIYTTNQVLANIANEFIDDKKEKDITYIFRELKTLDDKITEEDVEHIVNGNRIIAGYKLFKVIYNKVGYGLNDKTYDQTSAEQLADQFVVRHGYGRHITTGLDKLYSKYSQEKNKSMADSTYLISIIELIRNTVLFIGTIITKQYIAAIFAALLFTLTVIFSGESHKDYTYDILKVRYKRIRNDIIIQLKSSKLSKSDTDRVLQDIYFIDEVIKNTYTYKTIYESIANTIFSSNRRAVNSVKEQQLLEELASNELFIKSAEYKTIS